MRPFAITATILVALLMLRTCEARAQVCDNQTDDTAAIQTLADQACKTAHASGYDGNVNNGAGIVNLPVTGKPCYVAGNLTIDASCAEFHGNGTSLWSGTGSITVTTGQNSYSSRPVEDLRFETHAAVGVMIAGNHITFDRLRVNGATTDVQLGNNAYSVTFNQPFLFDAEYAFYCPPGLSDAGEQILFNGGSLFNSSNGIACYGPTVVLNGTAVDFISNLPISVSGALDMNSAYMEEGSPPAAGYWIQLGGGNAWGHVVATGDTKFIDDSGESTVLISDTGSNTYAKFTNDFFSFGGYPQAVGSNAADVAFAAIR